MRPARRSSTAPPWPSPTTATARTLPARPRGADTLLWSRARESADRCAAPLLRRRGRRRRRGAPRLHLVRCGAGRRVHPGARPRAPRNTSGPRSEVDVPAGQPLPRLPARSSSVPTGSSAARPGRPRRCGRRTTSPRPPRDARARIPRRPHLRPDRPGGAHAGRDRRDDHAATGREVSFQDETIEEAYASRRSPTAPPTGRSTPG